MKNPNLELTNNYLLFAITHALKTRLESPAGLNLSAEELDRLVKQLEEQTGQPLESRILQKVLDEIEELRNLIFCKHLQKLTILRKFS
jgi:hypothetical protein